MSRGHEKVCSLQRTVGRHERCPGDSCPFWDAGRCAIDGVRPDLETTPELAAYLLELHARLAGSGGWAPFRFLRRPGNVSSRAEADPPASPADRRP